MKDRRMKVGGGLLTDFVEEVVGLDLFLVRVIREFNCAGFPN
jgi:hypothetical protein